MERIGQYSITRTLGQGGMGVVYLAHDERLDRQVAIKCVKPEFAETEVGQQLRREARTLAKLNDENIVRLYDLIESDDQFAVVMEYVDGRNLRELLEQKKPGLRTRMNLLVQVAHGLAAAHKADVVHRDLKPENILVTKNNIAKLTDFGIAKNLDGTDTAITDFGIIKGTVTAMSPEQLLSEPVDYRSDLFSLGILAYRLLADQSPFSSTSNPVAAAQNVLNEKPTPLNELNPNLPEELGNLVLKLLQRDKDDRPSDTEQVALALAMLETRIEADEEDDDPTMQMRRETVELVATELFSSKNKNQILPNIKLASYVSLSVFIIISIYLTYSFQKEKTIIGLAPTKIEVVEELPKTLINTIRHNIEDNIKSELINSKDYHLDIYKSVDIEGIPTSKYHEAFGVKILIQPELTCTAYECKLKMVYFKEKNNQKIFTTKFLIESEKDTIKSVRENLKSNLKIKNTITQEKPIIKNPKTIKELKKLSTQIKNSSNNKLIKETLIKSSIDIFYNSDNHSKTIESILEITNPIREELENEPSYWLFISETSAVMMHERDAISSLERYKSLSNSKFEAEFQEARILHLTGRNKLAESMIKKSIKNRPTIKNKLKLCDFYISNNRPKKSLNITSDLLIKYPKNFRIMSTHADSLLLTGKFEEANYYYDKIVNSKNENIIDLINYSLSLNYSKKYKESIELLEKNIELIENNTSALINLADAYKLSGEPSPKYGKIYRKVIKIEKEKKFQQKTSITQALIQIGDEDAALKELNSLNRNSVDRLFNISFTKTLVFSMTKHKKLAEINYLETLKTGVSPIWFNLPWFTILCDNNEFKSNLTEMGSNSICH